MTSAYAKAGVDYTQIQGFKDAMVGVAQLTLGFPLRRDVKVEPHSHGAVYSYQGSAASHCWAKTQEGLGNKNWIAELMYQLTGQPHYFGIAIDAALMIVNDVIAQGALPVVYLDEVAAGDSEWFADNLRAADYAAGVLWICEDAGMALGGGESPSLRYLVNAEAPVRSAPTLSGSVTGIIAPSNRLIADNGITVGDSIIGVTSSGIHANGISLVIKEVMKLPDTFLTLLPSGSTVGHETLIPTRSYVALVETLLDAALNIHALLPGTGDGIAKLAFEKQPRTYRVHTWVETIPPLFQFMLERGVSLEDCLKTFNWGIGYYIFLPPSEVDQAIKLGTTAGYDLFEIGVVEEGERMTIFEPANLRLPPPGE